MRRLAFTRESFVPKGAIKVSDKESSAVAFLYSRPNFALGRDSLYAVAFHGKAQKPDFHYRYSSEERREAAIRNHFENIRAREKRRADEASKRKGFAHSAKVGDIYRTCWGYDQTNVEFFEIVEIRGKHAILREIGVATRDDGQGCERCVPQSGDYLEPRYDGDDRGLPIRRLIQDGYIKIDCVRNARPWGARGPGGIVLGEPATRTAAGWGH